jgi:hypothetical protein
MSRDMPRLPFVVAFVLVMMMFSVGCAPARKAPQSPPPQGAPPSRCHSSVRQVSLPGRAGVRPEVAVAGNTFAVAWEEEGDSRGVRVQLFDAAARPVGDGVVVSEGGIGSDPRIVADPSGSDAGFAVFWTVPGDETSAIALRRLDARGQPRGPATEVLRAPGARALAVAPTSLGGDGFVLAWWNWSGTPHRVSATFLDGSGAPVGRAVAITESPSADPTVDVAAPKDAGSASTAAAIIAWEELVDGVQHVEVADLSRGRRGPARDVGRGESPELGDGRVVFERPEEHALYSATLADGGDTVRLGDGHTPAAARRGDVTALCFIRDTSLEDGRADELWCGSLAGGSLRDATQVTLAPHGLLALQLAASSGEVAVAYQVQEEDDTSIAFAALSCPSLAAVARARQ